MKGDFASGVLLLVMGLIVVSAIQAEQPASWNVRDHIPLEEIVVQSHRGAGALSPENSLEAFEIAWNLNTIPEADLRTTRDGVIVAFHDKDFRRILPSASPAMQAIGVEHLTFDEVSQLDIGAWKGADFVGQRVPRLTEVYDILRDNPKRRYYIDIKNVELAQLARESEGVHGQLILASTDYDVIRRWMKLAPRSATLHWMGGTEEQLTKRLAKLRETDFADVTQLQIHVRVAPDGSFAPRETFLVRVGQELRNRGILFQTLPWECDDPEVFWRLMDLGVASFATDYPDVAMRAIRDYYAKRDEEPGQ